MYLQIIITLRYANFQTFNFKHEPYKPSLYKISIKLWYTMGPYSGNFIITFPTFKSQAIFCNMKMRYNNLRS